VNKGVGEGGDPRELTWMVTSRLTCDRLSETARYSLNSTASAKNLYEFEFVRPYRANGAFSTRVHGVISRSADGAISRLLLGLAGHVSYDTDNFVDEQDGA